eukprot:gene7891-5516_t
MSALTSEQTDDLKKAIATRMAPFDALKTANDITQEQYNSIKLDVVKEEAAKISMNAKTTCEPPGSLSGDGKKLLRGPGKGKENQVQSPPRGYSSPLPSRCLLPWAWVVAVTVSLRLVVVDVPSGLTVVAYWLELDLAMAAAAAAAAARLFALFVPRDRKEKRNMLYFEVLLMCECMGDTLLLGKWDQRGRNQQGKEKSELYNSVQLSVRKGKHLLTLHCFARKRKWICVFSFFSFFWGVVCPFSHYSQGFLDESGSKFCSIHLNACARCPVYTEEAENEGGKKGSILKSNRKKKRLPFFFSIYCFSYFIIVFFRGTKE